MKIMCPPGYAPCLACWALFGSLVPAMRNRKSCAQVHKLPQNHCGDNWEATLFSHGIHHWRTELSDHEFNSLSEPTLYSYSNFISLFSVSFRSLPSSVASFAFKRSLAQIITLVAEWFDTYGAHHWRIFRSSYKKLAWVWFEATTTEFRSDAVTDWGIRLWVQLALSVYISVYTYISFIYFLSNSLVLYYTQFNQMFL